MKNIFWIEERPISEMITQLLESEKELTSLWDFVKQHNKKSRKQKDYFTYPLAYSNTFYGFDDAGNIPYEEQEKEALEKFNQYKEELSLLLEKQPNQPIKLPIDFEEIETDEGWEAYYAFQDEHPIVYELEGDVSIWSNEKSVLLLSMNKEDKELPFEIHLAGITLGYFNTVVNEYQKIISDIQSEKYTTSEETPKYETEEAYYEKYYSKLSIQAIIKDREHHNLTGKNSAIKKYLEQNKELPKVFDDKKCLIFHCLDSINYIVDPMRQEDIEYMNLVLQHGGKKQLNIFDNDIGMTPLLYAYARGLSLFAEFLQTKGATLQNEKPNDAGQLLLLEQLLNAVFYKREKVVENTLPFINNELIRSKEKMLWEKLLRGNIYGKSCAIAKQLINNRLNPKVKLKNGTNVLAGALLLNDVALIKVLEEYLPIEKHINQTDHLGNSLLHLWTNFNYNNSLPSTGIEALKNIVKNKNLSHNILNNNKQTALHLLATREVDPYNEKDEKKAEINALKQAFDLISIKTNNINQQDKDGNTPLHYFSGYKFLENKNNKLNLVKYRFNKTNEQQWRLQIIKKMIAQGADISQKNNAGYKIKDIAELCRMDKITKLFQSKQNVKD